MKKWQRELKRIENQIKDNAPKIEREANRIGIQIKDNAPRVINDIPVVITAVVESVSDSLEKAHNPPIQQNVPPLIFSQQPQPVPVNDNANPNQNVIPVLENDRIRLN